MIISTHIPKCAGTSFKILLERISIYRVIYDYQVIKNDAKFIKSHADFIEDSFNVIHGHFLPEKYIEAFPNAQYITFIREPYSRIKSHYYYWKSKPEVIGNPEYKKMILDGIDLVEFSALPEIKNLQSKYLLSIDLERWNFIGAHETIDESTKIFLGKYFPQFKDLELPRVNVTQGVKKVEDTTSDLKEKVLQINDVDNELYNKLMTEKVNKILL